MSDMYITCCISLTIIWVRAARALALAHLLARAAVLHLRAVRITSRCIIILRMGGKRLLHRALPRVIAMGGWRHNGKWDKYVSPVGNN